jgi:hypothetical protein
MQCSPNVCHTKSKSECNNGCVWKDFPNGLGLCLTDPKILRNINEKFKGEFAAIFEKMRQQDDPMNYLNEYLKDQGITEERYRKLIIDAFMNKLETHFSAYGGGYIKTAHKHVDKKGTSRCVYQKDENTYIKKKKPNGTFGYYKVSLA